MMENFDVLYGLELSDELTFVELKIHDGKYERYNE